MRVIPEVKTILLTGGIGSGKSSAAAVLSSLGIAVYNADTRVKALYENVQGLVDELEKILGCSLRDDLGSFDKKKLATCIFGANAAENLALVEGVVFPYLLDDFKDYSRKMAIEASSRGQNGPIYVAMESATALEKTVFHDFGDIRLVVDAPIELRLERACMRDGATREQILDRMNEQPLMNSISKGDVPQGIDAVIMNDSTLEVLQQRVKMVLEKLTII